MGPVNLRVFSYVPFGVNCELLHEWALVTGDRVKTDRRDAVAIARLLRNGDGERVYVPTTGDETVHDYLRCREDLREEARRYRQRPQHCLIRHGHIYRGGGGETGPRATAAGSESWSSLRLCWPRRFRSTIAASRSWRRSSG